MVCKRSASLRRRQLEAVVAVSCDFHLCGCEQYSVLALRRPHEREQILYSEPLDEERAGTGRNIGRIAAASARAVRADGTYPGGAGLEPVCMVYTGSRHVAKAHRRIAAWLVRQCTQPAPCRTGAARSGLCRADESVSPLRRIVIPRLIAPFTRRRVWRLHMRFAAAAKALTGSPASIHVQPSGPPTSFDRTADRKRDTGDAHNRPLVNASCAVQMENAPSTALAVFMRRAPTAP